MTLLAATGFDVLGPLGTSYQYLFRRFPGSSGYGTSVGPGGATGRHSSWASNGACASGLPFKIDTVDKHATAIVSFAAKVASSGTTSLLFQGFGWNDSDGRGSFVLHWTLRVVVISTVPTFELYRGDASGTLLASVAVPPSLVAAWSHYALKITIDDSGSYDFRYDDGSGYQTLFSGSADTRNGGNDALHAAIYTTPTTLVTIDDLIYMNGAGSSFNDFIGDRQIMEVYPTSDNTAVWTGSDGNSTDNYALVDEHGGNIDVADYVEGRANGDEDLYVCSDLPVALTAQDSIDAVVTYVTVQRLDSGTRHVQLSTATAAGTLHSPDLLPPLSTNTDTTNGYPPWRTRLDTNLTKPGGGIWTESAVNDLRIGQKVTA